MFESLPEEVREKNRNRLGELGSFGSSEFVDLRDNPVSFASLVRPGIFTCVNPSNRMHSYAQMLSLETLGTIRARCLRLIENSVA